MQSNLNQPRTEPTPDIEALKRRDPDALAAIFDRYANRIYRLAVGMLHDEQQADGVVQDTFIKLIERIDAFEGRADIGTWLYRVAYNECLGRLRREKRHRSDTLDDLPEDTLPAHFVDWGSLPETALADTEAQAHMQAAIAALPPSLRAVFTLRDVEELSTRETAQALSISEGAVKVRLHRARLALRESLAAYFEEYVRE